MSDSDSKESLSNVSENSFIILDTGSLPNQTSPEGPKEASDLGSLVSSKSTTTCGDFVKSNKDTKCSFSEGSIQEKLNELVKENYQLKETLSQNNLAIKSQLDTFFMWQQEVLKTHETHKQKFLETKDLILKLRMENLSLKKQLEGVSSEFSVMSVNDTPGLGDKKPEDSDKLRERIKEFESICDGLANKNENLGIENQKLGEELAGAKKEILKLKKELEDVVVENMFLKQWNESCIKNSDESIFHKSLPNAEARTQISNLFKQLEEEKSKVLKLKEALKQMKSTNKEASDANTNTTDELSQSIEKLSDMNNSLNLQNQRISSFHSWVSLAEDELKENQNNKEVDCNLMCEIKEFKSYLNLEGDAFKEKQESVQTLKKQFTKLLDDYKILQKQLNLLSSEAQNIDKFKEEIRSLSLELQTKDNELISKQRECDDLKELIKTNAEEVDVLQVQVEQFRSDFNCEREAREKLVGEKEQMAEQIRFFQSQIKEFQKLNSQGNDYQEMSSLASPERKTFKCPRCLIAFSNLSSCEKHVDDCLDTFMYP